MHHVVALVERQVECVELGVPGLVARHGNVRPGVVDGVTDLVDLMLGEHERSGGHEDVHVFHQMVRQAVEDRHFVREGRRLGGRRRRRLRVLGVGGFGSRRSCTRRRNIVR